MGVFDNDVALSGSEIWNGNSRRGEIYEYAWIVWTRVESLRELQYDYTTRRSDGYEISLPRCNSNRVLGGARRSARAAATGATISTANGRAPNAVMLRRRRPY